MSEEAEAGHGIKESLSATFRSRTDAVAEGFLLGFMASREGFNGECSYEHCSPLGLEAHHESEADFRKAMSENGEFLRLQKQAVARCQE